MIIFPPESENPLGWDLQKDFLAFFPFLLLCKIGRSREAFSHPILYNREGSSKVVFCEGRPLCLQNRTSRATSTPNVFQNGFLLPLPRAQKDFPAIVGILEVKPKKV